MRYRENIIILIVTLSGFCSLVYQVSWDRIIRYNFGGDSVSSAIVTSTFLLGLGVGAFVFKRYRNRSINIYAKVELFIGLFAIVSYFIFSKLAIFFGHFINPGNIDVDTFRIFLIIVCFLFLLPPCILMGGTLPLMFNSFINPNQYDQKRIGLLYGFNTLGACVGIFSVPLFFFNQYDLPTTLFLVGGLNIILSFSIRLLGKFSPCPICEETDSDFSPATEKSRDSISLILAVSFISGAITLSMELVLFRMAAVLWPSSAYNFSRILMPLLLALSLGSFLFARTGRGSSKDSDFFRLSVLFLLSSLAILWTVFFRDYFKGPYPSNALLYVLLIFPYALFQGGIFPILLRMASSTARQLPTNTGIIYLLNSLGAFSGALVFQFVIFPGFGTKIAVFSLIYLGIGTSLLLYYKTAHPKKMAILPFLILLLMPIAISKSKWDTFIFGRANAFFEGIEGVTGVVTIDWNENKKAGGVFVNGEYMSSLPDNSRHIRLAVYPLSWPKRENLLVLGIGGGGMIREFARDEKIKKIDIVDWSHELPDILSRPNARLLLNDVFSNPKVTTYRTDARVAVSLFKSKKYDVIVDNLSATSWVGATSIKSVKYFHEISRILKDDGIFILVINATSSMAYDGVLAGLVRNFNFIQTHNEFALSARKEIVFDLEKASKEIETRKQVLQITPPYVDWLSKGRKDISNNDYSKIDPILDELLIHEFYLKPIPLILDKLPWKLLSGSKNEPPKGN